MTSHEFILVPTENYIEQQPKSLEILDDATINEKAKILTLLQRQKPPKDPKENKTQSTFSSEPERDIIEKQVLKSLSMMKTWQIEKSKPILRKIHDSPDVSINEDGFLTVDDKATSLEAANFLFKLQQPKTGLHDPDYRKVLSKLELSPQLVPNSDAKKILQPSVLRKKVTASRSKTPKIVKERRQFRKMKQLTKILKKKRLQRDVGTPSEAEIRKLDDIYKKGPAAYGSVENLKKASGLSLRKVENFLQGKNAQSKYRQFHRRFPRLKVIA